MKILFVAQRYHPFLGGVETQTRLVANELARDHEVHVAAVNFKSAGLPSRLGVLEDSLLAPAFESYRDGDVQVHAIGPSPLERLRLLPIGARALPRVQRHHYHALLRFGYGWYRRVYVPKLRALMQGVDVVHSVAGNYLGWAAQEAARAAGVPFVCTPYVHPGQHGDDEASVAFYKRSDAVFALLETDQQFLRDLDVPDEKIHISGVVPLLPPTVDAARFRARHGLEGKPFVLYVGRLVGYKGVPALLASAEHVWRTHPEARFVFVGPADAEMKALLDGLPDKIMYLGMVSEQEKADALAACDVFCMPSNYEILPAVYLEAWSYGKPVIGGKAHGLPELIEGNEAGVTVPQEPGRIAEQVGRLLGDEALRAYWGENGRALVQRRYSKQALVDVFTSVYRQVQQPAPQAGTRRSAAPVVETAGI